MGVALLALLIACSGAAVAAIPSSDGTISACRDNRTGVLRLIDAASTQTCRASETQLAWKDGINGKVADSLHADQADNATNAANADTVDGKNASDFYAAGSKVADSELLDGKDSTEFLGANGKAADSELLDGKNANDLTRVAQMVPDPHILTLSGGQERYGQPLSIEAPAAGFVRLSGTVTASGPQGSMFFGHIRHIQTQDVSMHAASGIVASVDGNSWTYGNIALDAVFPVAQGTNTFEFLVDGIPVEFNGVQRYPTVYSGQLTAEYTPYGPTGTDTLGTTANQEPISAQQLEEMNP
jgi:hypothetical protein